MIEGKRVLALIPARGGSKGIKNKNIIDLCGKPLISYTIEAARASKYIDDVIVSTDSQLIGQVSIKYGAEVPFLRPDELASDTASTLSVVLHSIETLDSMNRQYDILVLLQATSPLRTTEDIDGALEQFEKIAEKDVVAVSIVNDPPILIRTIENGVMQNLIKTDSSVRRQDMMPYYRVNGSIYINSVSQLNNLTSFNDNPIPYIIAKSHAVDIDEYVDLKVAEYYINCFLHNSECM